MKRWREQAVLRRPVLWSEGRTGRVYACSNNLFLRMFSSQVASCPKVATILEEDSYACYAGHPLLGGVVPDRRENWLSTTLAGSGRLCWILG
jgi:hypothetical protein